MLPVTTRTSFQCRAAGTKPQQRSVAVQAAHRTPQSIAAVLGSLLASPIARAEEVAEVVDVEAVAAQAYAAATSAATAVAVNPDILSIVQEYPILTGTGAVAAAAAVVLALTSIERKPSALITTATAAYDALEAEPRAKLLDIRPKALVKAEGVFNLKDINQAVLSLTYAEFDEEGEPVVEEDFLEKFAALEGIEEDTIFIVVDSDGSLAQKAANAIAGAKILKEKVFYIKGGMEGKDGWKESELPWKPYRAFELPSVSVPDLQTAVQFVKDTYEKNPQVVVGTLAAAGVVAAVGGLTFIEVETVLQIVGLIGAARLVLSDNDRNGILSAIQAFFAKLTDSTAAAAASEQPQLLQERSVATGAAPSTEQLEEPPSKAADTSALAAALAASGVEAPVPVPAPAEQPVIAEAAPAPAPAPVPEVVVAAEAAPATPVTPENVAEAREWISAWKERKEEPQVEAPANVAEAREWIAAWKDRKEELQAEAPAPTPEVVAAAAVEAPAAPSPAPVAAAAEAATAGVPANVAEAREWIAKWKAGRPSADAPEAPAAAAAEVFEAVKETVTETVRETVSVMA